MFTEEVVGFIGKLADDTAERTIIQMFPNQKPWVDKNICDTLRPRTAAYNEGLISGNMDLYKAASYNMRRVVRKAKRSYGGKLQQCDSRNLWKGLRTITNYKNQLLL